MISTEAGRKRYLQPEENWIQIPFPPLVDEDTWSRVQELKKQLMSQSKRNTQVFCMLRHQVRCSSCGTLLGGRATKQNTVRRNGKVYHYDLDPPRRYYQCYGMQKRLFRCRENPSIPAGLLVRVIWTGVTNVVQHPEIIVSGMEAIKVGRNDGLAAEIEQAERDLRDIELEEDRAIRLCVSGKISEDQLDRQRKFIADRLKHCQSRLEDYRSRQAAAEYHHTQTEHLTH